MAKFYNIGFILLLVTFILPGRNLFGINIGMLTEVYIIGLTTILVFNEYSKSKENKIIFLVIYFQVVVLMINILRGIYNGNEIPLILSQGISLFTIFVKVLFIYYFINYSNLLKSNNKLNLINVVYIFAVIKVLSKIFIGLYAVIQNFGPLDLIDFYMRIFNVEIMSTYISPTKFLRAETPSDVLPFFVLIFAMYRDDLSKYKKTLAIILMSMYVTIVYSRVTIAFYIVNVILFALYSVYKSSISYNNKIRVNRKIYYVFIGGVIIILLGSIFIKADSFDKMLTVINERFFSFQSEKSDEVRDIQEIYLKEEIKKSPVIGGGVGGYTSNWCSNQSLKYSYELEHLALIMQLGVFGFILIVGGVFLINIYLGYQKVKRTSFKLIYPLLMCTAYQIVRMTTNPSFIHTPVLILVSQIYILNSYRKKETSIVSIRINEELSLN